MGIRLHDLLQSLVVACLVVTSSVHAALLDRQTVQTLDIHGIAPALTTIIGPVNSVVGPGIELTDFAGIVHIDFSDTNIFITATRDAPFSFFEILSFVDSNDTIPDFLDVTVNPATDYAGFDVSRIIFNADIINVTLTALPGLHGQ